MTRGAAERGCALPAPRSIANCKSPIAFRPGFTLTEVLIVIGIIILVIALAVPALALLTGSGSISGAENNISAMLGRARADALGLQKDTGVFFFIDPATDRVTLAEVWAVDGPATPTREVYIDLVPDRDWLALPKGVLAQVIDNAIVSTGTPPVRADDAYIGFNTTIPVVGNTMVQYGGVILFDSAGRLTAKTYAFRGGKVNAAGTVVATDIKNLLMMGDITKPAGDTDDIHPLPTRTQYGLVLVDRESFMSNGDLEDVQITGAGTYATDERPEETWLDENAVPLVINRFNGTLVRGE